jgi:hypothetical protein
MDSQISSGSSSAAAARGSFVYGETEDMSGGRLTRDPHGEDGDALLKWERSVKSEDNCSHKPSETSGAFGEIKISTKAVTHIETVASPAAKRPEQIPPSAPSRDAWPLSKLEIASEANFSLQRPPSRQRPPLNHRRSPFRRSRQIHHRIRPVASLK